MFGFLDSKFVRNLSTQSGFIIVTITFMKQNSPTSIWSGQIIATSHGSLTPKGSVLKGKSPEISGKSRLVKYYSIWPDLIGFRLAKKKIWIWRCHWESPMWKHYHVFFSPVNKLKFLGDFHLFRPRDQRWRYFVELCCWKSYWHKVYGKHIEVCKQISIHNMGVSKNNGTPKSSILMGFSIINHPFWGTPIFGNINIYFLDVFSIFP